MCVRKMTLSLIIATLVVAVAANAAGEPQARTIQTWNAHLNAKIADETVQVLDYIEPDQHHMQEIDAALRQMGYPESYIVEKPWAIKEALSA